MRVLALIFVFINISGTAMAQGTGRYRGSIPEALLRPARGEAARYPIDTVIGQMGQGAASDAAFSYANWVAAGLLSGRMNHPALEPLNPVIRESYLSTLGSIDPRFYRIGGGREEPDGSTSFLVRFVGREQAITAEMYIRHIVIEESGNWSLEDLIFEEAMSRQQEEKASSHRVDAVPYERFY